MLTGTHEAFYKDQVRGMPSSRLLIQPCNRGAAPAILHSLLRISDRESNGVVAFFPSDHYFADEAAFIAHIDSAYTAAALRPERVILVGIPAMPRCRHSPVMAGAWKTLGSAPGVFRRTEEE
jgi:mannose-1-phosphate guanylyltransferase